MSQDVTPVFAKPAVSPRLLILMALCEAPFLWGGVALYLATGNLVGLIICISVAFIVALAFAVVILRRTMAARSAAQGGAIEAERPSQPDIVQ